MKKTTKPSIVPTLISSQALAWSAVVFGIFLLSLWIYFALDAAVAERRKAAEQVSTRVESEFISCDMPKGWAAYTKLDGALRMRKYLDRNMPYIAVESEKDEFAPYHALDMNPSLIMRKISARLDCGHVTSNEYANIVMHGVAVGSVNPEVPSVNFMFSTDCGDQGVGTYFYCGDRSYFVWSLVDSEDKETWRELRDFFNYTYDTVTLPPATEEIDRPIVHSGRLTAEGNSKTLAEVSRELAMWRLFRDRAETEPAAALLPAISHFREAVRLLSSVRQEKGILADADFAGYRKLVEIRKSRVNEWFVMLDKYRSTGDVEAARRQIDFIAAHATLKGEASLAHKAQDMRAEIDRMQERKATDPVK